MFEKQIHAFLYNLCCLRTVMEEQRERASSKERDLLAKELHDTVKQQIFALASQISIIKKIHAIDNDPLAQHLEEATKIVLEIQEELTNLVSFMSKDAFEKQALIDELAKYISRWSQQSSIMAKFTTEILGLEQNYFLSAQVKKTFFRVAQEALSNVARHSNASYVEVTIAIGWCYVALKIVDNGQGFSFIGQERSGVGLTSMKERMNAIGGYLLITGHSPSGTEVLAAYKPKRVGPDITIFKTLHDGNAITRNMVAKWDRKNAKYHHDRSNA